MDHKFDSERCRHYLNDNLTDLHCHHYATHFTQLALDTKDIVDGTKILFETAENIFHKLLIEYFQKYNINETDARADIASKMFSAIGMGKLNIININENSGDIELPFAYVDEGWLKKWGKYSTSVNFIGMGYIAGMFSAIFDKPVQTYKVDESQSKVMGAEKSILKVTL